jgi:hypothetical protein
MIPKEGANDIVMQHHIFISSEQVIWLDEIGYRDGSIILSKEIRAFPIRLIGACMKCWSSDETLKNISDR